MEIKDYVNVRVESVKRFFGGESFLLRFGICDQYLPGQFILVRPVDFPRSRTPIPLSVYNIENGFGYLFVKVAGENTRQLSELKPGDNIYVRGPVGKAINLGDDDFESVILVGGGYGCAALALLGKKLGKRAKLLFGSRNSREQVITGIFEEYGCPVSCIAEQGQGMIGKVTDLLEAELKSNGGQSLIVACGPKKMLKAVAELAKKYGNPAKVTLEEMVACGIGACQGCAIKLMNGQIRHICEDGTIFDAQEVDWDWLIQPDAPAIKVRYGFKDGDPIRTRLVGQSGKVLDLETPLIKASGTVSPFTLEQVFINPDGYGAITLKGATLQAKIGNPPPRMVKLPAGMGNSIGLENVGAEMMIEKVLPRLRRFGKKIIANIAAETPKEFGVLAGMFARAGVDAIGLNVSCPNLKKKTIGFSPEEVREVVYQVYLEAGKIFIIVKLPPIIGGDLCFKVAEAARDEGADAILIPNTLPSLGFNPWTRQPLVGNRVFGMSGAPLKSVALKIVNDLYRANLGIPIIGGGGIACPEDAMEFFLAGASAVEIGIGDFMNANLAADISDGLIKWVNFHKAGNIMNLVGAGA